VRDGLKPVHRRILYSMYDAGIRPGTPFRKCARVVGDVMGWFHPHSNDAIYDALVRLGQDFASRYPLVQPQGNFGTVDDPPAAMRYTETRMAPLAMHLLDEHRRGHGRLRRQLLGRASGAGRCSPPGSPTCS
jgi:DNA gyrase subunit A